jgi:hypothetical protein
MSSQGVSGEVSWPVLFTTEGVVTLKDGVNSHYALISQIYFEMKLYMFRTVPVSVIRSYSLSTQDQDPARKLSTNLYNIYHC